MIHIVYTVHAKQYAASLGISDEMVCQAVEQPNARATGCEARSLAHRCLSESGGTPVVYVE